MNASDIIAAALVVNAHAAEFGMITDTDAELEYVLAMAPRGRLPLSFLALSKHSNVAEWTAYKAAVASIVDAAKVLRVTHCQRGPLAKCFAESEEAASEARLAMLFA
jgi:hypothetical protein